LTNTTATTGVDWHLYSLNNGNLGVYNNTSGSYSLLMTSGQNVVIGGSSVTNSRLEVNTPGTNLNEVALRLRNTSTSASSISTLYFQCGYTNDVEAVSAIAGNRSGSGNNAFLTFITSTGGSLSEGMRLTPSNNLLIGTTTDNGQKLRVNGTGQISDIMSVGTLSNNNGLSTNTKLRLCGDGSTNAGASMGSCFAAAGVGSGYDTGISVNMGTSGGTMLLMASINTSTGTSTNSAVYIVRFYFDGNNAPTTTYLGGSSDFVTFSVSGSNTLILTASNAGNRSYSWFINKLEN
jgi:hypothetical protein